MKKRLLSILLAALMLLTLVPTVALAGDYSPITEVNFTFGCDVTKGTLTASPIGTEPHYRYYPGGSALLYTFGEEVFAYSDGKWMSLIPASDPKTSPDFSKADSVEAMIMFSSEEDYDFSEPTVTCNDTALTKIEGIDSEQDLYAYKGTGWTIMGSTLVALIDVTDPKTEPHGLNVSTMLALAVSTAIAVRSITDAAKLVIGVPMVLTFAPQVLRALSRFMFFHRFF